MFRCLFEWKLLGWYWFGVVKKLCQSFFKNQKINIKNDEKFLGKKLQLFFIKSLSVFNFSQVIFPLDNRVDPIFKNCDSTENGWNFLPVTVAAQRRLPDFDSRDKPHVIRLVRI